MGAEAPALLELPITGPQPVTDLVRPIRRWFDGLIFEDQLILIGYQRLEIDLQVLGERSGRDLGVFDHVSVVDGGLIPRQSLVQSELVEPIAFDDLALTEAELAAVQLADTWRGRADALTVDLVSGAVEPIPLDGLQWAETLAATPNSAAATWHDLDGDIWLSTSGDGSAWSTRPLSVDAEVWFTDTNAYTFPIGGPSSIRRSHDAGRTWQRTRRPFTSSSESLAVDDILVVVEERRSVLTDEAGPTDLAISRWDPNADDPEWLIEPLDTVFHGAIDVDFVAGPEHLLAIVTTTQGYDYYVASTVP